MGITTETAGQSAVGINGGRSQIVPASGQPDRERAAFLSRGAWKQAAWNAGRTKIPYAVLMRPGASRMFVSENLPS